MSSIPQLFYSRLGRHRHSPFDSNKMCASGFGRNCLGVLLVLSVWVSSFFNKTKAIRVMNVQFGEMGRVVIVSPSYKPAWRSTWSFFPLFFPFPHPLLLDALPPSDVCVLSRFGVGTWKPRVFDFMCAGLGVSTLFASIYVFLIVVNGFVFGFLFSTFACTDRRLPRGI